MKDILTKIKTIYNQKETVKELREELKQYFLSNNQEVYNDLFKYNGREWVLDRVVIGYDPQRLEPIVYIICKGLSKKEIGKLTNYRCYCFVDEYYRGRLPFYIAKKDEYCFLPDTK